MQTIHCPLNTLVSLVLTSFVGLSAQAVDGPYHKLKEIPIGGAATWDYAFVDEPGRRLYVSHGTEAVLIDVDKDTIIGVISNTPGIHGIAVAPKLGRGFTSNGRENKVSVFDLTTLAPQSKVDTGQNPDAILFESGQGEVYAFNGRSQSATVIEAASGKVVATIPLGGKPESAQVDVQAGMLFDNIEDKNEVVVIDTRKHEIVNHWPIAPGEGATGMGFDAAHHRLVLGCGNSMMVIMDSTSGKVVTTVPTGPGTDAAAFDPGTQYAFTSNGANGTVTIAHEDSPDKFTVVQTLATERGSRTMTLDPKTHRIYLAAGQRGTPNSFKVLVFGL